MRKINIEKFMDFVSPEPNTGCWIWEGILTKSGYGDIYFFLPNNDRINRAHRISYYLHNGPFPLEKHVLHKCDNRWCVNPQHLYLGTHQQNMADRTKRGTTGVLIGEENAAAKLTTEQVFEIRNNPDVSIRSFADKFNISYYTIWDIRKGRSWQHLLKQ